MNEQNRVSLKEKWKRYRLNHSAQSIAASAALYLLLFLCAMAIFLPSIWAVMTSFKEETEVLDANVTLFPKKYILDNYRHILSNHNVPIFRWFFNSFKIAVTYVVLYLLISSMAAFAFSRLKFKGRDAMFWLGMSSMVIPGVINMIPHYIIIDKLGLVDNMFAMVLPGLGGVGGVFLLRQFMKGVPMAYDEAAKIDGANEFHIYWYVVLPMCLPVLVTLAIFSFQGNWNDYVWPLIVTNSAQSRTLTAGLATFSGSYAHQYGKQMAGAVLSALPILLIFVLGQKFFIKGIAIGGIKG